MAKSDAVWGIDVGQCALKALKCRLHNDGKRLVAEAYDFIEYPKILSQPDADPVELVNDAIAQFLSRNDVAGDKVAISVSGQSGLARFIKLPPVESKKIPDIVKFEARQQIPFALEDVVWDFQQMAGGSEEDGYSLETEVGLFAMKRDQVFRALRPFTDAGIEVDLVQLTPIALYNYIVFDQMQNLPPPDQYDPENPPESVVVMSLGTDTTDLVITNGYRVWQRSIPLGGNHFTKAITKEMKVTFSKAEQLKRNALKTDEAKAIFQAMRPIFNDLVTEVQRSISFFGSLNKTARLGRIVALGNTMKLRGLQKYLAQNLGMDVVEVDAFRGLSGQNVVNSPAYKDNHLAFGVCYGLCVQGAGKGALATNLLPDEIFQDRMVKEKKPWAVAAVALLLIGCMAGFVGYWYAWSTAKEDMYKPAFAQIDLMQQKSNSAKSSYETALAEKLSVAQTGMNLAGIAEQRLSWAELMKAVNECLPRDPAGKAPADISKRNELHITKIDCEFYTSLADWFTDVGSEWQKQHPKKNVPVQLPQPTEGNAADGASAPDPAAVGANGSAAPVADAANGAAAETTAAADPNAAGAAETAANGAAATPAVGDPTATGDPAAAAGDPAATGEAPPVGPTGEGWVIQLTGHHYHNADQRNQGAVFIRNTLLKNLETKKITLPVFGAEGQVQMETFTMQELGIDYPVLVEVSRLIEEPIGEENPSNPAAKPVTLLRCEFVVQFCWKETPASKRLQLRKPKEQQASETLAATAKSEQEATP
jgi:type IV pilus assembly protein PilM